MGLSAKVGSFNTGTGALGTTVVVNDVGFQPKVVLFWWNGRTGTTDASGRATHQRGFGVGVSSSDRRNISSLSQDTPSNMVTNATQGNAACIALTTTGDLIDGLLDVQSMDSGGFTLVVDDVFTASYRIHYLALGGSDITDVVTGQFTGNSAGGTGNQDVTSLSFQPDFLMLFSTNQATANNTVRVDSRITIGAATSSSQAVWAGGSNDGAANAQTLAYCRSGEIFDSFNSAVTSTEDRAAFSQFLSNGFRINWSEVTTGGGIIFFLAMKGGQYRVDSLLTQTNTSTAIQETGFGFSPKGTMLVSACRAESSADTATDDDEWSMGAFTSTTARVAMSIADDDAAGTAVVSNGVSHDEVYQNLNATDGTVEGEMDVQSIDSDGFTLIMDDADPSQSFVWYMSFGQSPIAQSVSGAITPAGSLSKTDNKSLSGSNTPSGSLSKSTSKTFSGAITPSGALLKQVQKVLSGAITSITGALETARIFLKDLAGTLTSSGAAEKSTSKSFTGSLSPSGSVLKNTNKTFDGTLTSGGSLLKQANKFLDGTVAGTGGLIKSVSKFLSGTLSSAGALITELISGGQTFFKDLAGSLTPQGDIQKSTSKSFSGAITPVGELVKSVSKFFSGIVTSFGTLTSISVFTKALDGTIAFIGSLTKHTTKDTSGTLSSSGSLSKSVAKFFAGQMSMSGGIGKSISKALSGVLSFIGNLLGLPGDVEETVPTINLDGNITRVENLDGIYNRVLGLRGNVGRIVRLKGKK